MNEGTAIIIGAGPAGLTAAIELQRHTRIKPVVIEADTHAGGLSRTVLFKGNRMDIGGHRFFSKSDRVMRWWLDLIPLEANADFGGELRYQGKECDVPNNGKFGDPSRDELVMLVRQRKSRIYFKRRFFDYPIRLTPDTLIKMGLVRTLRAGLSFTRSAILPRRNERTLEDFLINRFGRELYQTFFRSYTEKVWGIPCNQISAEWGAQRIKGLSLKGVVTHFFSKILANQTSEGIAQKQTQTSLIEKFLYPKLGPGQLWEHVANLVSEGGGDIHYGTLIDCVNVDNAKVVSIAGTDSKGQRVTFSGNYFFSTMPVRDLVHGFSSPAPADVREVSDGLLYRDFITVGLLAKKLNLTERDGTILKDNWIYVQESDVLVGRLQIFNNWSPWLVADEEKVWIGLEYFCNDTDPIWTLSDEKMAELAIEEVCRIGILKGEDVEDFHVVRVPKTYPAYFGTYDRFHVVRNYLDRFSNLFLIGRNGMHKYNNQDHSMLTAMTAVENIVNGVTGKDNIWAINTEMDYHEEKSKS
jgi:protoporphyrinogen oxidase